MLVLIAACAAHVLLFRDLPNSVVRGCLVWGGVGWVLAPARTFQWAACFSEEKGRENSALALITQAGGAVTLQVEGPLASLHGGPKTPAIVLIVAGR